MSTAHDPRGLELFRFCLPKRPMQHKTRPVDLKQLSCLFGVVVVVQSRRIDARRESLTKNCLIGSWKSAQ
jgi:hypothetical protein